MRALVHTHYLQVARKFVSNLRVATLRGASWIFPFRFQLADLTNFHTSHLADLAGGDALMPRGDGVRFRAAALISFDHHHSVATYLCNVLLWQDRGFKPWNGPKIVSFTVPRRILRNFSFYVAILCMEQTYWYMETIMLLLVQCIMLQLHKSNLLLV